LPSSSVATVAVNKFERMWKGTSPLSDSGSKKAVQWKIASNFNIT